MTMPIRDIQSEVFSALQAVLAPVTHVEEGDVRAIFDAEDDGMPDEFIVLQPGATDDASNGRPRMPGSVLEQVVINIVLVSKKRNFAPGLRALRLGVLVATAGQTAGLNVRGVGSARFLQQTPTYPQAGRRWAAHVMPLEVTYTQPLA